MKLPRFGLIVAQLLVFGLRATAATLYVDLNSPGPAVPYSTWATAATNIQDAVDASLPGDLVLVTDGVYQNGGRTVAPNGLTNRVAVDREITVESVNGPAATVIQGYQNPGGPNGNSAVRCVYLTDGATLTGFTLIGGATGGLINPGADYVGGGIWCASTNVLITNCVISNNAAAYGGGGVYGGTLYNCTIASNYICNGVGSGNGGGAFGSTAVDCIFNGNGGYSTIGNRGSFSSGAFGCTLTNCILSNSWGAGACNSTLEGCTLTGNSGPTGGGAIASVLNNCVLSSNVGGSPNSSGGGGGAYNSTLTNCTLTGNRSARGGGAFGGTLVNCLVISNDSGAASAAFGGGGAYGATLNGCLILGNSTINLGSLGTGGGTLNCVLNNCTVVSNWGSYGGGTAGGTNNNCIVMFNSTYAGLSNNFFGGVFNYCDSTPQPASGLGNISADPLLTDSYHISAFSPCCGAGSPVYAVGTDLDGEPWLNPPSIGCAEYSGLTPLAVSISARYTNVAAGSSLSFAANVTGSIGSAIWNFGDGGTASNTFTAAHTWQAPGNYTVTLTVYNIANPGGVSTSMVLQVVAQAVHYVSQTSTNPVSPYSSWATAATNIQDAVDATSVTVGELVLVSNGVYNIGGRVVPPFGLTNRLVVANPVVIQSINGSSSTVIEGSQAGVFPSTGANAVRCVWLGDGAVLTGFTLVNGASLFTGDGTNETGGGGIWCATTNAVVSNCLIISNAARGGAGAYGGNLFNCDLVGNVASIWGGGAWQSLLNNSVLMSNSAGQSGGGAYQGSLNNCLVTGNSAGISGGGANGSALVNCTVVSNSAASVGGGIIGGFTINSILLSNSSPMGSNYYPGTLNYCCTTPLPAAGVGNITNDPLFVNFTNGNFRLQSNSPCINDGNNGYVVGATDLDGNPRISGGTVDMGAYEFQNPASIISYAWLQQYGFATDGSADYVDSDHNGMNNWQKWVAGVNPTNAASVLQVLDPVASGTNLIVTWQSVTNISYFLQRGSSLAAGSFQTIVTNIAGQAGTTSYTDTNASGPGPWFYRVGVP